MEMIDSKIPKTIHYCWFGGNPKPPVAKRCMDSWVEFLPDYELVEWNEGNFDISSNSYVKAAHDNSKWAFVSDYVRLWALYHHGGIYMDTDVLVFKTLDPFLNCKAFTGFENYISSLSPVTAVIGAVRGHSWIRELLDEYQTLSFIDKSGELCLTPNTARITDNLISKHGVLLADRKQIVSDDLHIYPSDYFCNKSSRSYTQHLFDGSWMPYSKKLKHKLLKRIRRP